MNDLLIAYYIALQTSDAQIFTIIIWMLEQQKTVDRLSTQKEMNSR